MTAQPIGAFPKDAKLMNTLFDFITKNKVEAIVIGYPRSLNGSAGPMAKEVESFGQAVAEATQVPIHYWDERFSTAESENILIAAGVRREKRKEVRDQMAATL